MSKADSTDTNDLQDDLICFGSAGCPKHIDGYEVLDTLGSGGMGEVFLVRDRLLDREIALKLLRPPLLDSEVRGVQEIKILKSLNHDGIVRLLGEGTHEGRSYFTMERVDGTSLAELLNNNRVAGRVPCTTLHELLAPIEPLNFLGGPLGDLTLQSPAYFGAIRIVQQVAAALDYLHGNGIIHRDIKPSNIIIKSNGRVQLIDFGIAQLPPQSGVLNLTNPGTVLGTDRYSAPEQQKGKPIDQRTDVYGLGAVLYELVCGVRLFDDVDNPRELISEVLLLHPKSPILLAPKIPRELSEIILKALRKDHRRRYSSTIEFAEALQQIITPTPPTLLQKAAAFAWWIIHVFFFMGLVMSGGAFAALYLNDKIKQHHWPHPLVPALIPLAVAVTLGILVGGGWYALSHIWVLYCRLWAWLRRAKSISR